MLLTKGTLSTLGTAFSAVFKGALKEAEPLWNKIALEVPSTTGKNDYGWMNAIPRVRKWVGDRIINRLSAAAYSIVNDDYEITLGVKRNDIDDDNLGIYTPIVQEMGRGTASHYDELCFDQLKNGFTRLCYDGQNFFDTDHPILNADGVETVFANTDGGGSAAWFVVALDTVIKPVILQKRKGFEFVSKDAPNDDGVFFQKELVWGADARHAVGYGLPQLSWGSKQTLDATHFNTAVQALMAMKTDHDKKLGLRKFALVVGPSNRAAGQAIVAAERLAGGASNTNFQAAELVVAPWLD